MMKSQQPRRVWNSSKSSLPMHVLPRQGLNIFLVNFIFYFDSVVLLHCLYLYFLPFLISLMSLTCVSLLRCPLAL